MSDDSKIRTAKALAQQYAPTWTIPPGLNWIGADRSILEYFGVGLTTLRIARGIWADRLEAIENGTYYDRGDLGRYMGLDSFYNARYKDNRSTKFNLDRCEAYTYLWWIDMFIQVCTQDGGDARSA